MDLFALVRPTSAGHEPEEQLLASRASCSCDRLTRAAAPHAPDSLLMMTFVPLESTNLVRYE